MTRGVMGFGKNSRIHRAHLLGLSDDLPERIEVIDSPAQIALLDRDPMADTAIGSIEGSRTCIARQLPYCREGQAIAGSHRMQGAVRVNLSAAAFDDNLAADNFRTHRARVGTSGAGERPYPVEILATFLRHRLRRFFGCSFRLVARFGKERQPDACSDGVAVA